MAGRRSGRQQWTSAASASGISTASSSHAHYKARNYNLDIKNPHAVADDHGDPEALLAELNAAEVETVRLRDQLKAILAEALTR